MGLTNTITIYVHPHILETAANGSWRYHSELGHFGLSGGQVFDREYRFHMLAGSHQWWKVRFTVRFLHNSEFPIKKYPHENLLRSWRL